MYLISTLFGIFMKDLIGFYQRLGLINKDLVIEATMQNFYITDQDNIFAWTRILLLVIIGFFVLSIVIIYLKEEKRKIKKG